MVHLGHGYYVQLEGYGDWSKYSMTLIRFKQIRSAFHPDYRTYFCGDKFHQLRYFILMFNDKEIIIFFLGEYVAFYEEGITMSSRYCPVHIYNKDKPYKYRVGFSSFPMQIIISYIGLMCNKVIIKQTLTYTHHYTTYPPHINLLIML